MFQSLILIITIYKLIIVLVVVVTLIIITTQNLWKCSSYRIVPNYLEKYSKL